MILILELELDVVMIYCKYHGFLKGQRAKGPTASKVTAQTDMHTHTMKTLPTCSLACHLSYLRLGVDS